MTSLRFQRHESSGPWPTNYQAPKPQSLLENRWNGHAVAAFALCFVPGLLPAILAVTFGSRAIKEINVEGGRGKQLAIWAMIIAVVLSLGNIGYGIFSLTTNLSANSKAAATSAAVQQLNTDIVATANQTQANIASYNPTSAIPVIAQPGEVIKVTYITKNTWFVKGYLSSLGNPDRDFIDRASWVTPVQSRFTGAYGKYVKACGCNTGSQGNAG